VVVWQSSGVAGRRYDRFGNVLGSQFQVTTVAPALKPRVAVAPNGEFMIVYRGVPTAVDAPVFGRRYDTAGTPLGPPFRVSVTPTVSFPYEGQAIAVDGAGNFVVAWFADPSTDRTEGAIWARRYAPCGATADPDGDGFCGADDICPTVANVEQTDTDGDGAGDPGCDNCPGPNRDQADSDGDCAAPGADRMSCGDICDVCPIDATNGCDVAASGGATIGPTGGVLQKGSVKITVPAGAVSQPTSFSITKLASSEYGIGQGSASLDVVKLGPEGAPAFNPRVAVQFSWTDPQLVALGINESNMRVYQNGVGITNTCGDSACRLPACTTGGNCGRGGLTGVAGICCDPAQNTWTVPLASFSELVVADDPCVDERICHPAAAGSVRIIDQADPAKDKLVWKLKSADPATLSELGNPLAVGGDGYALCFADASSGAALGRVAVPAGGQCGTQPCWKASGTSGFKYKRSDGLPEGATSLVLKAGPKPKAIVKGAGAPLTQRFSPLPAPPLPPLRVQLRAHHGPCWEAQYLAPTKNVAGQFKAKASPPLATTTSTTSSSMGSTSSTMGSTTSTMASTTSTTTIPAFPCGSATAPQCDGACPVDYMCVDVGGTCFCAETNACEQTTGSCSGRCGPGGGCIDAGGGACQCAPTSIPCGDASAPQCDGICSGGLRCVDFGGGTCGCQDDYSCGAYAGAPQCWGTCPAELPVCRDVGGTCSCGE
jgi:hypothetical protein